MKHISGLVLLVSLAIVFGDEFPSDVSRCKHGDTSCLNEVITKILHEKPKGHPGLNLISFDPLRIKSLSIEQDQKSPVNIQLKFTDVDLIGISTAVVYKTVGFGKDPTATPWEIYAKFPKISLVGPYTVKGQILVLPITGAGASNFTFENVEVSLKFLPKVVEKNGQKYIEVTKLKFDMTPSKMISKFENLFNGDKTLGENMNAFLNDNWKDIFGELKSAITRSIAEVLQHVINGPFSKIPYDDLFQPE